MIKVMLLLMCTWPFAFVVCNAQQSDSKLYVVKDTVITGVDTLDMIHTKLKVGIKAKRKFSFDVAETDTILYSLQKENNTRMKYRVIKPNDEKKEYVLGDSIGNMLLETDAGGGSYVLELKNRSFKKNYVIIDLKKVKGWSKTEQIKEEPPLEDSVTVIVNDTVPRVVYESTFYIGSKKNIKAESEKVIEFTFATDSVPCQWMYLAGFGKEYESNVNSLVDIETQQPVGDPLVAGFMGKFKDFPYSQSQRAKMNLKGPGVNRNFNITDFNIFFGKKGVYRLSVTNNDEVVGEYVYFKVVAFDMVKKSEIRVPVSEFNKMKISQCLSN